MCVILLWPGHGHILVYPLLQVLVLLLQHLQSLLQVHVLFSLLKNKGERSTTLNSSNDKITSPCPDSHHFSKRFKTGKYVLGWRFGEEVDVSHQFPTESRNLKPTIFSSSEIFRSCWCICWFFISRTSFRLFRSSSMCLYGAKASCQTAEKQVRMWENWESGCLSSCTVLSSSYHNLLVRAPAQGLLEALGSVSEAAVLKRQRVHLILENTHRSCVNPERILSHSQLYNISFVTVYLQWQSDLFKLLLQRLGLLLVGHLQVWGRKRHVEYLWVSEDSRSHRRCSLFTVRACSSCSVASVSLWVDSISIKDASWLSLISSIWSQGWNQHRQHIIKSCLWMCLHIHIKILELCYRLCWDWCLRLNSKGIFEFTPFMFVCLFIFYIIFI